MGMEVPGWAKTKEHLCEYVGSCSFPCGCLAFSPHRLLSRNRCHHRKMLAAYHVTLRTPQTELGGFSGCGTGETHSTHVRGCSYPPPPSPFPHPQWVYLGFKLKTPCREKQTLHLAVCIKSPTVSLTLYLLWQLLKRVPLRATLTFGCFSYLGPQL